MNYDYLKASDGTGDAALMHIQTDRSPGSATIDVDSVSGVPPKFIGTYGTLLSTGLLDSSTKRDFKGHVDSGNLIIDGFFPGNTDAGNTAGQVVIIKPNTPWSNLVAAFIMNATGHGTPENLTVANLTADDITADSLTFTDAVLLDGLTNAAYRYTVTGTDFTNTYKILTFAHGLGYTPEVEGRWAAGAGPFTTFMPLPTILVTGGKSYFGKPQDLTVAIRSVDATNISVGIAIHTDDGSTFLAANYQMRFQFFCRRFPGTA